MTSILVVLMLTICSPQECTEQVQTTWQADSTNALTIALEQCDAKATALEEETKDYYRCVIDRE